MILAISPAAIRRCTPRRTSAPRPRLEARVSTLSFMLRVSQNSVDSTTCPRPRVHEAAMVASTAYVEAGAQVGDHSRIGAGSWLDHDVIVGEDVVVAGNVHLLSLIHI